MSKRQQDDPLVTEVRYELMPGRFVRWNDVSRMVSNLYRVHEQVESLVKAGEATRAVRLYEIFLTGVYDKIEEADDECSLAMLFHRLACGWIQARQAAGLPAEETVGQLLNWLKNDQYGFCLDIEREVIQVMDAQTRQLFLGHFQERLEQALPATPAGQTRAIFEYQNDARKPALTLKEIYQALGDAPAYAALSERLGLSPRDCEHLAEMEKSKKHWAKALEWVEKGMALKPTRNWHNENSSALESMKPELLRHLGRKEDALAMAWADFEEEPSEFTYEELMRYVPKGEKATWQERAMAVAEKTDLEDFISLCVKAKEWDRLAARVHAAQPAELEALSHYCTEPAAEGLAKRDAWAAAKLYQALGLRIVNAAKSKYYREALEHFESARKLYSKAGHLPEWQALVDAVRVTHSRKAGFLSAFEQIVSGSTLKLCPLLLIPRRPKRGGNG